MDGPGLSTRQRHNRAYARRARARLDLYLPDEREAPVCVLAELGRIRDDAGFREAVWWWAVYSRDLTAKQSAAKIREMRRGEAPQEGPATLYKRLLRTTKDFRTAYPDASLQYVESQIRALLDTIGFLRSL